MCQHSHNFYAVHEQFVLPFIKRLGLFVHADSSSVQLCFYDKRLEVEKAVRDHEEIDFDFEWFESGKPMTCVEFRLFSGALRGFGVKTEHDLYGRMEAIIDMLTHDWFRILERPKVRGTENRAAIHPLWERVRKLMIAGKGDLYFFEK